ncbi:MAG: prolyl oligopeptidase family serine peptidase, partial [Flavisolibacter sp.]
SCKKSDSIDRSAKTLTNVSYGTNAAETMDVYLPAGRSMDSTKTIVMIHGGAWVSGDKSDFASFIPVIQRRFPGYAIANINYKLATTTDNHFPTQENDMKAALDYLVQKASDYQLSHNFILLGASAGAHMALLQAYKYPSPKVLAVVDFFGPTNMVDLYNFYSSNSNDQVLFQLLMSGTPQSNPALYQQSSPINFVTSQSCPTIIFHGTADVVVPLSESVDLKNKMSSLGVPNQMTTYPNVGHEIWPPNIMTDVYNQMEQFIKTNVH